MDILKAEMSRKRKEIEKAEVVAPSKKFFRRGDLAAKQQEEYWRKYYEKHADKRPSIEENPVTEEAALDLLEKESHLSDSEVIRRLRERSQPIRLFGEMGADALRRLRKFELDAPELKEGRKNDFKLAMDQVDQEYLDEVIQGLQNEQGRHDVAVEAELRSFDEILEMVKKLGSGDAGRDCEITYAFFNYLLQRWGRDLNARSEDVKRSAKGKFESATHTQTVVHIKPLFSKLRNKMAPSDIREHLVHICCFLVKRDYIKANNAYMEMAVGNAPWPVGVTASGIHQRPGSEKMYVRNVAHVLNDETQRKYIQGLKRLMTRCQQYFPTDPSRSVEFIGGQS